MRDLLGDFAALEDRRILESLPYTVTFELALEEWVGINWTEESGNCLTNPKEQSYTRACDGSELANYEGLQGMSREDEGCTTALKALRGHCNPQ